MPVGYNDIGLLRDIVNTPIDTNLYQTPTSSSSPPDSSEPLRRFFTFRTLVFGMYFVSTKIGQEMS